MADNFASSTNPDGKCCDTGPTCPTYTVTVVPVGSTVASGLPVALAGTLEGAPWTVSGTTNGSGVYVYTMPASAPYPVVGTATVGTPAVGPSAGCIASASFNSACSVRFSYCRFSVTATFTPAANPTLTTDDTNNLAGLTRTISGNQVVWDHCCLVAINSQGTNACTSPNRTVVFKAADPNFNPSARTGYLPRCQAVLLNCGVAATVDLTQESYPACYDLGVCGPHPCLSTLGGPYPGARPRKLQVRLTTKPGDRLGADGTSLCQPIFAGDDGQWITLTDLDSGVRGGAGNFLVGFVNGQPFTAYPNCPSSIGAGFPTMQVPYDHVRVTIQPPGTPGANFTVVYRRYNDTTSVNYANTSDCMSASQGSAGCQTLGGFPQAQICVPLPSTALDAGDFRGYFTIEFRDACGLTDATEGTGGTADAVVGPTPMMMAPAPAPNLLQKAASFARAATTQIAAGNPATPSDKLAEREAICGGCEHLERADESCKLCGCGLKRKRAWLTSACPIGKW